MVEKYVPKRQYTEEFRTEGTRLALSVGQHKAACRLGVAAATLGNWTRRQRNLEATSADGAMPAPPARRPAGEMETDRPLAQGIGQRQARYRGPSNGDGVLREGVTVKWPGSMPTATNTAPVGFAGVLMFPAAVLASSAGRRPIPRWMPTMGPSIVPTAAAMAVRTSSLCCVREASVSVPSGCDAACNGRGCAPATSDRIGGDP